MFFYVYYNASVRPTPPPPHPGLLRVICLPRHSRGGAFANFALPRGPGICQPRGHLRAFDTHAVSYKNITRQKVLLEKKQIGSPVKDRNKLKRVVKACSRFYAYLPSLLSQNYIAETGAIDVNQRVLVIESNFC